MLLPLLSSIGMIGLIAGLFGLYLARLLLSDGWGDEADETRHNALLLVISGAASLAVSLAGMG